MNRFVNILNRIRQNVKLDWLTPSQQIVYNLLRERLRFLDEVNLWGGYGTGKTFLGWVLYMQGLAVYSPRLEDVEPSFLLTTVVVDNLDWHRAMVRESLHKCRVHGYKKVVLITDEPVQDQTAVIELQLTNEDLAKVSANLRGIGVSPYSNAPRTLWDLVSPIELIY